MTYDSIIITNLVKEYKKEGYNDNFLALDHLNLSIPQGSIFGLLGPNGAGKSTLINILAGIVTITKGFVSIMGIDITKYPKHAKSLIGVVPQEITYDTFFSIEQSLELSAGYYGISKQSRKTTELLKVLGLWSKRKNYPQQLSGGMKRRFLIAKAMVHSPKVLVLDEPTAGVDIDLRKQLWEYVVELNKLGTTLIITTHYLAEAQEFCNEIAFINKGKIIKQDKKEKLLSNFGTRFADIEFDQDISTDYLKYFTEFKYHFIKRNKLRFQFNMERLDYNYLFKQIAFTNAHIVDIKVSEPSLEQIFYKIINE